MTDIPGVKAEAGSTDPTLIRQHTREIAVGLNRTVREFNLLSARPFSWTGEHTWTGQGDPLTLKLADDAATWGPRINLVRTSGSAAGNDLGGSIVFKMNDDAATPNLVTVGDITSFITSPTSGSLSGGWLMSTTQSGTSNTRLQVGAGVAVGGALHFLLDQPAAGWLHAESGVKINGSDVTTLFAPASDALEDLSALGAPSSDGEVIVATGPGAFAYESGSTLRSSIGTFEGTSATTLSGTATTLTTSIPSDAKIVFVHFRDAKLSGTENLLVQGGDSGGFETSGYWSDSGQINGTNVATAAATNGWVMRGANSTLFTSGTMILANQPGTNNWAASHSARQGNSRTLSGGGHKSGFSATLDRVRITQSGANTLSGSGWVTWLR